MGSCVALCIISQTNEDNSQNINISPAQSAQIRKQLQKQQIIPQEEIAHLQKAVLVLPPQKTFKKSRFYQERYSQNDQQSTNQSALTLENSTKKYSKTFIIPKKNKRCKRKKYDENDWIDESVSNKTNETNKFNLNFNKQLIISQKQTPFLKIGQRKPLLLSNAFKDSFYASLIATTKEKQVPLFLSHDVEYEDGAHYKGQWRNGARQGIGKYIWPDGSFYQGCWINNNMQGKGKICFVDGEIYAGQFHCNCAQGQGQFIFKDHSIYKGSWKNGLQQGQGCLTFQNQQEFSGTWRAGKKHGYGELCFIDGSYYKGQFENNEIQGKGQYNWEGKKRYKGTWKHNQMHDKGFLQWINGDKYSGNFCHNKMHGKGYFYDKNGSVFSGTWQKGRKNGTFIQTKPNGQIIKELWAFNKLIRVIQTHESQINEQQIQMVDTQATV